MVDMKVLRLCSWQSLWCHPLSCSPFAELHLGISAESQAVSTAYGIPWICAKKLFRDLKAFVAEFIT